MRQKAEIYARDRAICCFSGVSLWLLDYGAAPSSVDWADHITAASSGGAADIENGACASALYNWVKRQHKGGVYLFHKGQPTLDFYLHHGVIPQEVSDHLLRFSSLHWSDWFFNRAVFHVLIAADQNGSRRLDGKEYSRDKEYWSSAAVSAILQWRKGATQTTPLKNRGLLPKRPSRDQKMLLGLMHMQKVAEVKMLISEITPYVSHSKAAMEKLAGVTTQAEIRELKSLLSSDQYITPRTKSAIKINLKRLPLGPKNAGVA